MTHQTNETGKVITQIVIGTRLDHVPAPETQEFFTRLCMECYMETVTKSQYSQDVALVCNVCAPAVTERLVQKKNAQLAFEMPPDTKAEMIEAANRLHMPIEEFLKTFVTWRTGKVIDASVYNSSEKKK